MMKINNAISKSVVLIGAVGLLVSLNAFADGCRDDNSHIDKRHERLVQFLNLDQGQSDQVKAIISSQHEKMQNMREDMRRQLSNVLTEEQMSQFDSIKEKRKGPRFQR